MLNCCGAAVVCFACLQLSAAIILRICLQIWDSCRRVKRLVAESSSLVSLLPVCGLCCLCGLYWLCVVCSDDEEKRCTSAEVFDCSCSIPDSWPSDCEAHVWRSSWPTSWEQTTSEERTSWSSWVACRPRWLEGHQILTGQCRFTVQRSITHRQYTSVICLILMYMCTFVYDCAYVWIRLCVYVCVFVCYSASSCVCVCDCVCMSVTVCMSVCLCAIQRHPLIAKTALPTKLTLRATPVPVVDVDEPNKKIDWHDYTQIALDEQRAGTICLINISIIHIIIIIIIMNHVQQQHQQQQQHCH